MAGEREIETHAEAKIFRRVTRHHANNKFSGLGAEEEMQKADIMYVRLFMVIDMLTHPA